ncbi:MAG: tripartite tricarboxylate transporter TctB family protein [Anaerolineae bacterium]|nr:tripartite tricarboxylate transporter TctB family protein [Anaerolineae bacterium]
MANWDILFGILFALCGAWIFLQAMTFPNLKGGYPGPGLFPQILGILLVLSGLVIAINAVLKRAVPRTFPLAEFSSREKLNALLVVLAVIAYILFVDTIGFIPLTILITVGLMWRTGVALHWSVVVGVGVTLAIYILFQRILHVPLPSGILLKGWL